MTEDAAILAILPGAEKQLESVIQAYIDAAQSDLSLASRLNKRADEIRHSANRLKTALGRPILDA